MIRFETESGTTYVLDYELEGEKPYPFVGKLTRISDRPLISVETLAPMSEDPTGEEVTFSHFPELGKSFFYWHPTLFGCASTPVVKIETEDDVFESIDEGERSMMPDS